MLSKTKKNFSKILLKWHEDVIDRDMPWVGIKNPYHIWLSEVILQQTRVDQGRAYYNRFIEKYPEISDLANAHEDEVLRLWQGLGYYSRARNLHETSKFIVGELKGKFPNNYESLLKLKGVGSYTAAAIASFAYNEPVAVVDGNVIRVLARIFGIEHAFDTNEGKKHFQSLAQSLIDIPAIGKYNQAIMDFGALVCKPAQPLCIDCPFAKVCFALEKNLIGDLPVKAKKLIKKNRYFIFSVSIEKQKILIQKRGEQDIWKGLYQFPSVELSEADFIKLKGAHDIALGDVGGEILGPSYTQVLTHQKIHAYFIRPNTAIPEPINGITVELAQLKNFGFPKIIDTFIRENKIFKTV